MTGGERARWLVALAAVAAIAACQPWDAPNEKRTRTVEGCEDAVSHLHACCPRFDSYISCTYLNNMVASPDLTESQSRCLQRKSCAQVERAVTKNDRFCGFLAPTTVCK